MAGRGSAGGRRPSSRFPGRRWAPLNIEKALEENERVKAVALVHAETSTGVQQPLEGVWQRCHRPGALLVVDAVTSLGGVAVEVDIDVRGPSSSRRRTEPRLLHGRALCDLAPAPGPRD